VSHYLHGLDCVVGAAETSTEKIEDKTTWLFIGLVGAGVVWLFHLLKD
jgi:hypothetical protein